MVLHTPISHYPTVSCFLVRLSQWRGLDLIDCIIYIIIDCKLFLYLTFFFSAGLFWCIQPPKDCCAFQQLLIRIEKCTKTLHQSLVCFCFWLINHTPLLVLLPPQVHHSMFHSPFCHQIYTQHVNGCFTVTSIYLSVDRPPSLILNHRSFPSSTTVSHLTCTFPFSIVFLMFCFFFAILKGCLHGVLWSKWHHIRRLLRTVLFQVMDGS